MPNKIPATSDPVTSDPVTSDPVTPDPATPDIEERLRDLKDKAAKLAGGGLICWTSDDAPPEVIEQFLKNVLAYEEAKEIQPWDILVEGGLKLPEAEEMDDETLYKKLWELIYAMRLYGLYIERTDHLSDRQLYTRLWEDCLREPMIIPMNDGNPVGNWHIDLIGSGRPEMIHLDLKYYADEDQRREWAERFPDDEIPEHQPLPHDRDRLLPRPY